MRRYCRANRLDRLCSLTYAKAPADRAECVAHLRRFFERLQAVFGRLPIVAVLEKGSTNGRLHAHLAVGRFIPKQQLERIWGHGFVDIRKFKGKGQRWNQRELAAYLAKYVSKSVEAMPGEAAEQGADGKHRYQLTQGWTPRTFRLRFYRLGQAEERLRGLYGQPDVEISFGDWTEDFIFGRWYSFPDHLLHPPPGAA